MATARALQARTPLVPSTSMALLGESEMGKASKSLLRALAESIQRRAVARAEAQTDEDYDQEQADQDAMRGKEEEELQFNISEVLGSILKTHGGRFLPAMTEDWLPRMAELSHEACLIADRKLAAFIFCDVLEFCGEATAPVFGSLMPHLLLGIGSEEPTLRQPCAYGIGVAAAAAPGAFGSTPFVEHALQQLIQSTEKPGARQGEQESATGKIIKAAFLSPKCCHRFIFFSLVSR